jgi:hypothetical protein
LRTVAKSLILLLAVVVGAACCLGVWACQSAGPVVAPAPDEKLPAGVVRLAGSPEEIGAAHGKQLAAEIRTMISEYVGDDLVDGRLNPAMAGRVRAMKPSLPDWFRRELAACAGAAGVDEDVLLYAQCEGDVKSLGGCTTFVAFGAAAAGKMEIGRNFDYWGLESTAKCAKVFAVVPKKGDGYAFVSVGWTGILGGWTFVNEKGLFVANNLGGFFERNPRGVPTLILERIVAQKAATLEEAIALVKKTPRMRGQALVIGHAGDPARGVAASAAVIQYDAKRVEVSPAGDGFALHSSVGTDPATILAVLKRPGRAAFDAIKAAGNSITLHSVAIRPREMRIWVAHGRRSSAHLGKYLEYDLARLLRR